MEPVIHTYYFHLCDGCDVLRDPEGRQFPSVTAMLAATLFEGRDIIANDAKNGWINLDQRLEIEVERGMIVHRLNLADAVKITGYKGRA